MNSHPEPIVAIHLLLLLFCFNRRSKIWSFSNPSWNLGNPEGAKLLKKWTLGNKLICGFPIKCSPPPPNSPTLFAYCTRCRRGDEKWGPIFTLFDEAAAFLPPHVIPQSTETLSQTSQARCWWPGDTAVVSLLLSIATTLPRDVMVVVELLYKAIP